MSKVNLISHSTIIELKNQINYKSFSLAQNAQLVLKFENSVDLFKKSTL